ncbi:hypothetical protein BJ965_002068 [Streptomyces luteogriseus]|uniref:Uncharacterized protein n=1 Tax=Streptomyces luteogriseus TaxID=68233 RepID=A0A7W7GFU9_9ACTN|nr:hypothetical protein [Streptomyces luteogriseus]MBB4712186.1 hypothetical protein [Streptomyces luteogriseus]
MAGIARWGVRGAVLGMGALWWWAVLRLLTVPGAGALEAAVAAGGWGLSVLPVHCVPKGQARGVVGAGRWWRVWGAGVRRGGVTTASPRPRSGGGSGPW